MKLGKSGWKSPLTMKGGGTRRKMAMIVNGELDRWVMMWKASINFMLVNFLFQSMANGNRFPWRIMMTCTRWLKTASRQHRLKSEGFYCGHEEETIDGGGFLVHDRSWPEKWTRLNEERKSNWGRCVNFLEKRKKIGKWKREIKEKKIVVKCIRGKKNWNVFIVLIPYYNSWEANSGRKKTEKRKK